MELLRLCKHAIIKCCLLEILFHLFYFHCLHLLHAQKKRFVYDFLLQKCPHFVDKFRTRLFVINFAL